jgi:hypothetical protein
MPVRVHCAEPTKNADPAVCERSRTSIEALLAILPRGKECTTKAAGSLPWSLHALPQDTRPRWPRPTSVNMYLSSQSLRADCRWDVRDLPASLDLVYEVLRDDLHLVGNRRKVERSRVASSRAAIEMKRAVLARPREFICSACERRAQRKR